MKRKLLVTAALPYSNGRPHVGHLAGAYLPSDIYVRFKRLRGHEVRYVCGSDDHGVAIMLTADKEGKTPQEVADYYRDCQKSDFAKLNVNFDIYGSTSRNPFHAGASQDFFRSLYEQGYFDKQSSRQFYDTSKEMFLPDRYVKGICKFCKAEDQNGDQCENCGEVLDVDSLLEARSVMSETPAVVKETVHWFLDLTKFEDRVKNWIENSEIREHTKNYVKGLLSTGLIKRSMTRDIPWGIPVPLDDPEAKNKVLYVWFDAPIGYISNTMQWCEENEGNSEKYVEWWKNSETDVVHFIGEDNTIFHCVIWIAMLSAEGTYNLPKAVVVNQFLNIKFPGKDEEKISKSRGTAIWLGEYADQGGSPDVLRYYLTSIAPEKARTVYNPEDLIAKNNSDLANTLGNYVNRVVSFSRKFVGDVVPELPVSELSEVDIEFRNLVKSSYSQVIALLEAYQFKAALEKIMDLCRAGNKYVDVKEPWKTRKTDLALTQITLGVALEAIYGIGVMLEPFMPDTSKKILDIFGKKTGELVWSDSLEFSVDGITLNEPVILFEKLE